jgi:hypothetical protein
VRGGPYDATVTTSASETRTRTRCEAPGDTAGPTVTPTRTHSELTAPTNTSVAPIFSSGSSTRVAGQFHIEHSVPIVMGARTFDVKSRILSRPPHSSLPT